MRRDGRSYEMACPICRQASALYKWTGSDYAVMVDHPACQKCGILVGPAHVTKRAEPFCHGCEGMPNPGTTVAETLRMAELGRRSVRSYRARVGGFER